MKYLSKFLIRIKNALRSSRGESIMEAIVSLAILGILMTTLVSIIRFSMVMTSTAMSRATETQDSYNILILEDYAGASGSITFTSGAISSTNPNYNPTPPVLNPPAAVPNTFTANHSIVISGTDPGAFTPASTGGG